MDSALPKVAQFPDLGPFLPGSHCLPLAWKPPPLLPSQHPSQPLSMVQAWRGGASLATPDPASPPPQDLSYNQLTECPRELDNAKNMLVLNLSHNGCRVRGWAREMADPRSGSQP